MKKLFVSLMTAFLVGTASLTFATPAAVTHPVEAAVVIRPESMKLDVVTQVTEEASILIRLRDAEGHILHTKYISKGEGAIRYRFDLSQLQDGDYQVEISNGATKQVKTFTIQTTPPSFTSTRTISLS
jgi:hypothetical protein